MPALKGAFIDIGTGLLGAVPNIVVFQFNPETITRSPMLAQPPRPPGGAGEEDASEQPDEPSESISFTLRIDASDQLAQSDPLAASSGILPTLYALELLMVPRSSFSADLSDLAGQASAKSTQLILPQVLFVWGVYRILPVTMTSLSITETQYDTRLNPVRADVSVSLQVMVPSQIATSSALARGAYQYSQKVKQVMAALNIANAAEIGVNAISAIAL